MTARTRLAGQIFTQFFAYRVRFGFAVAALHIRQNTLKRMAAQHNIATVIQVFKVDNGIAAAIQDHVLLLFTQAVKGHIQLKIVVLRQRL